MGIRERLEALRVELEAHPQITVQAFRVAEPLAADKRRALLAAFELPEELRALYEETNGFEFRWSLDALPDGLDVDLGDARGGASVVGLDDLVDNSMFFVDMHDRNPVVEGLHALELDWDNSAAWAFSVAEGKAGPNILAVESTGSATETGIAPGAYVDRLLRARGVFGWLEAAEKPGGHRARSVDAILPALFEAPDAHETKKAKKAKNTRKAKNTKKKPAANPRHADADRIRGWIAKHELPAKLKLGRKRDIYGYYVLLADDFTDAALLNRAVTDYFGYDYEITDVTPRAIGDVAISKESDPL